MFFKIITGTTGLLTAPDFVQGGSRAVTVAKIRIHEIKIFQYMVQFRKAFE
ncbi:hypothetical protein HanPI659440_Chr15g0582781 [Helianthus annuus]|nr:hypothetical protein HanPI659440_Chr15g0582781 [Helianthus annuus]